MKSNKEIVKVTTLCHEIWYNVVILTKNTTKSYRNQTLRHGLYVFCIVQCV